MRLLSTLFLPPTFPSCGHAVNTTACMNAHAVCPAMQVRSREAGEVASQAAGIVQWVREHYGEHTRCEAGVCVDGHANLISMDVRKQQGVRHA
eukprot:361697-Chlamydomonas_euryale.AAC.3